MNTIAAVEKIRIFIIENRDALPEILPCGLIEEIGIEFSFVVLSEVVEAEWKAELLSLLDEAS